MALPNHEDVAKGLLDGAEKHFDARVTSLKANVDNLLAHTAGIDDHAHIDNALQELFEKLSAERDNLESVKEYRKERDL